MKLLPSLSRSLTASFSRLPKSTLACLSDVNDQTPAFTLVAYAKTINENLAINGDVLAVSATDNDKTPVLTFSLRNASAPGSLSAPVGTAAPFRINAATGQISLKALTDFETFRHNFFEVVVSDGRHTVAALVTVHITNTNEDPPEFTASSDSTGSVLENTPAPVTVATVRAVDPDVEDTLYFCNRGWRRRQICHRRQQHWADFHNWRV